MDNRKSIAIVLAFVAAVLVMLAGKSCAESIHKSNTKNSGGNNNYTADVSVTTGTKSQTVTYDLEQEDVPQVEYVTDILGRVIETVPQTQTAPPETDPPVEYITDILGRVEGTVGHEKQNHTEYVTDILGRVVGVEEHTTPAAEGDTQPVTQEELNPLEKYYKEHPEEAPTAAKKVKRQDGGQTETAPSEIHIKIN